MGIVDLPEIKTPAGNEMVRVNFEDGTKEDMPKKRLEMIVTNTVSDASEVQRKIQSHVGAYIYGSLHEFGIKMGEAEEILNAASTYVNSGYEKARDIKWGVTHRFLPLLDINNVLVEHAKKDNDGSAS